MPTTSLPTEFVVQRNRWRCGPGTASFTHLLIAHGRGATLLLNPAGYRCCLGFVLAQCGIPDEHLDRGDPAGVAQHHPEWTERLTPFMVQVLLPACDPDPPDLVNSKLVQEAIGINDDEELLRTEKEAALIKLFARHGYTLRFEGHYEDMQVQESV